MLIQSSPSGPALCNEFLNRLAIRLWQTDMTSEFQALKMWRPFLTAGPDLAHGVITQAYMTACSIVESSATTSQARQGCSAILVCTCRRTEMVPVVKHLCFCIHLHASSTTASSVKDGCKHTTHKRLPECLKACMGITKHSPACIKCIKKSQQATCVYCIKVV